MVSSGSMASGSGRIDGLRVTRTRGVRRDVWGVVALAAGVVALLIVLRTGAAPPVREQREPSRTSAPVPATSPGAQPSAATPPANGTDAAAAARIPRTTVAKLRALRDAGIEPKRGPDGHRRIDAAPVIKALNDAGVHDGIAAFPPPGTDPPKPGIIVPEGMELPEGYVRHYQTTDDGEPLPPILMFHPDYDFFDAAGNPIAIPEDRVVPPDLVPPGFPVEMLRVPERGHAR
jgi:hypothetical protein